MISVIIPTYNASHLLPSLIKSLKEQTLKPAEIIVIDSSSIDGTDQLAKKLGARLFQIKKKDFNHGLTRTLAGKIAQNEILVYLTQDAKPAHKEALEYLVKPLGKDKVVASFGRQIPPPGISFLAYLHRKFNYPEHSYIINLKATLNNSQKNFISNSFAAYLKQELKNIGWFPRVPCCEDVYVTAKFLEKGYSITYVAEAKVWHAHDFSLIKDFKRYSHLGFFHAQEGWIRKKFGKPEKEGWRYFIFVIKELSTKAPYLMPSFLTQTIIRWSAFKFGYLVGKLKQFTKQICCDPPHGGYSI